ncbi:peptidoglycan-binding domain-containing protein [Leisingera sp. ANG-M6]|uniref:peptidoglycan-binding domain-containing protein n=1 Tax=Leisingera sp. ANG-M6 TaxID=1577900 RepID=UPI000689E1D0|nr:peptidoglycan-binding domain-containing protein [Leisingera sp. ANG-M6]
MSTLKNGSKGPQVKALQRALNTAGAKPALKTDGKFGRKTEGAVKAFQKKARLKASGIAGTDTLAALGLGRKAVTWPLPDLLPERREVDKHYMKARKTVKAGLVLASGHKAYSIRVLHDEMLAAGERLDTVYAGVVDPLCDADFLHHRFDQLPASEIRKRQALIAQAKKTMDLFSKQSAAFYGHIIEIGRIESETKSAISKRGRVVWPVPDYSKIFNRNAQRLRAVKERMQEIYSDCYGHADPEVHKFAKEALKMLSKTDNAYVEYEVQFAVLNETKEAFERKFTEVRDDELLKIAKKAKTQYAKLLQLARICIAQLKSCWGIEKRHRKMIGFSA